MNIYEQSMEQLNTGHMWKVYFYVRIEINEFIAIVRKFKIKFIRKLAYVGGLGWWNITKRWVIIPKHELRVWWCHKKTFSHHAGA